MSLDEILGHQTRMDHHYESIVYQFVAIVADYHDGCDDRDYDDGRDRDDGHDRDGAIHDHFQIGRCECCVDVNVYWQCSLSFLAIYRKSFRFVAIVIATDAVTVLAIGRTQYDFYMILIVLRYAEGLVELMTSLV